MLFGSMLDCSLMLSVKAKPVEIQCFEISLFSHPQYTTSFPLYLFTVFGSINWFKMLLGRLALQKIIDWTPSKPHNSLAVVNSVPFLKNKHTLQTITFVMCTSWLIQKVMANWHRLGHNFPFNQTESSEFIIFSAVILW